MDEEVIVGWLPVLLPALVGIVAYLIAWWLTESRSHRPPPSDTTQKQVQADP
jgi:phage shock protein PspC (stress-responsive transcriptional regulator)